MPLDKFRNVNEISPHDSVPRTAHSSNWISANYYLSMFALALVFLGWRVVVVAQDSKSGPAPQIKAEQPVQADPEYVLGPEDVLKIWALGMEEISEKPVRIDPAGFVDLPILGRIRAAGLTAEQFRLHLLEVLRSQVREPKASIEVVEFGSQPVSVIG